MYMLLHHAQMCMFGRLSFRGKWVNIMWRGFILKGAVEWRRKLAFAGAL